MRLTSVSRVRAAVTGLVVLLLAAACGSSGSSATSGGSKLEKTNLVVGVVPAGGAAALYIAEERGLFAKQGLHVKLVETVSNAALIPNMLHGTVDVDFGGWTPFILAEVAGVAKLHVLANGFAGGPGVDEVMTMPHSGITTPAQLKGKTIAVNVLNDIPSILTDSVLAEYGIGPHQVTYVPVPFPLMISALAAHRVNAAYVPEPFVTAAEAKLGAVKLIDISRGATQDFPLEGFAVTQQWYQRYPKTAAAFTRAIDEANAIASTNRPAIEKAEVAATHIPAQTAAVMATGTFPTSITASELNRVVDLMRTYGLLSKPFNVETLLSPGS
jgi:NitT/TauT family transport system substrate-binding protein